MFFLVSLSGRLSLSAITNDVADGVRFHIRKKVIPLAKPPTPAQVVIPKELQKEITLLRGFRDLVGERWGYFLGRQMKQAELNDKTKTERKKVTEISKGIRDNFDSFIEGETPAKEFIDSYVKAQKQLKDARDVVSKKAKPFREKINPLRKAQKYLDVVAIPASLKELGTPISPRFSLSKWVSKAMQAEKK